MSKRLLMVAWLAVMFIMPALQGRATPIAIQNEIILELGEAETAQSSGYSGVIPMNLSVMVGDSGDDLADAYNFLAAVPFAIRSNSTHTASGLILPDDIENYASPLDDWLELLGGSMNELVFIGDVQNTDHLALTSVANSHTTITGTDHIEIAANLAQEFFIGTSSVVLVEAPNINQFSESITVTNTSSTLSSMSSRSQTGSTSSSSDWEYYGSFSPSGGGAIITLTSGDDYIWFDLLAREGSRYYPMDFPYYNGRTVMYPYEERPGSTWILHAIDFYDYDRTVTLNFDIDVPDADFYPFTVESGEDCRIDFDLSVVGGTACDIGLNVLDPSGNIILNANRFALIEDVAEVSEISANLSHPTPGQYRAYVYSAEHTSVSYDLSIVKRVISDDRQAAAAGAANGAGLASLLGAPLLYTNGGSLETVTLQTIQALSPQTVYFVNPIGPVDSSVEDELDGLGLYVHKIENFTEVQSMLSTLDARNSSQDSAILYDSIGTAFAAAGLSVAHRKGPAIPFSYGDSGLMTLSQIPEQISWNREYQMPLAATFSLLDIWTSSGDLSDMNPPVVSMTDIADEFFSWLSDLVGIDSVDDVISIAPYYGPGEALPPSFERALTGKAHAGRYSSIDTDATLVQIMRSILRVPLMSASSRSHEALGSYLVYSYGDQVMANNRAYSTIDNSNDFSSLVTSAGLSSVMQVGPSTISELADAPYAWVATVHGGIGYDLYEHDGRIALFNSDVWRAYDNGRSPSSPDADTSGSPLHVVNPPEYYMDIYNISQLVTGANLRGMFALLDSCQVGSSYGPSTLMESGADAVVACRTDTLVGPADMFEYHIIRSMVDNHETLGVALDSAFSINSHRYALYDIGLDTYVSSSDVAVVGASCIQFTIFGDPDITLYDWAAIPYPVTNRIRVGPSHDPRAYPGSTYRLPLDIHDPVGNAYALEGIYSISVFDTENNLLTSGTVICTTQEVGVFEIEFTSASPLGTYNVEITDTDDVFYTQIILEWPDLIVESIDSTSFTELGTWNFEIVVFNPQDVVAETVVQVSLNNDVLLISDASWLPGFSTNEFELVMVFGPSGNQTLNVVITIGTQAVECCNYDTSVLISSHWVTPVLWIVVPALSVCVAVSGIYIRMTGSKVISLQNAMDAEASGDHDAAFDLYYENRLAKAATRVAVKAGFPEEMMATLLQRFGSFVTNNLQTLANAALLEYDYKRASKIFLLLGHNDKGLQYKAIDELEEGKIDEAVETFHEIASLNISGYALKVISHLKNMNESTRSRFISHVKEDLLSLASRLRQDEANQNMLLSVVEDEAEDEYLVRFLLNMGRVGASAERILSLKTVPKMVKLTNSLDEDQRNSLAPVVVGYMVASYKPKQVAKYLTTIGVSDRAKEEAVSPIIQQLIQEPSNKDWISTLRSISKSSSTGSLQTVDDSIDAVESIIAAAEEMGVSVEHIRSSALVPVVAGLKDRTIAKKILSQIEKQALTGNVPASANIDALADYVYGLRSSRYIFDDVLPEVKTKLVSYEATLQNRLRLIVQGTFTTCQLEIGNDDWLEASSNEIAKKIISSIPVVDSISAVKACFQAMKGIPSHHIDLYLQNSVGVEEQAALANEMMDNPVERDRILRRQMKLRTNEQGRLVWIPNLEAAYADAMNQVLDKWKPQAFSVLKLGFVKAALEIAQKALETQIPNREIFDISVAFLFSSRTFFSQEKERILDYIRSLSKYLERGEITAIIEKAGLPNAILDEALP